MNKTELANKIKKLEGLTNEEKSALIELLRKQKKYGLVWEDKIENVEERLRKELPVLKEVKERAIISDDMEAPNHILIEGDNLEALTALTYTHAGKIDVIYIDPPYNTGNKDFIYNDNFVDKEDSYRHSKWLSFINKRLEIAKNLLSERGVIFISIDDNEQANLKLLCDRLFGEKNFVCNFIWRGGKRNMSKWVSTSHEYMLLYAKNLEYCGNIGVEWYEKKRGLDEIYKVARQIIKQVGSDYTKASVLLKEWYKSLKKDHPSKDHKHYSWIDAKGVYFASDISCGGGGGPKWEIKNPYTGETVKTPSRGWAYSSLESLYDDISKGLIHFNGNGVPCKKRYLKDNETQILETVFYQDRRTSSERLKDLMGNVSFPFPKDEIILSDKLESFSKKSSIILDFFAGSGTTLHATMKLNSKDGGHRQCILVTNNENNICENVTYVRNKKVIQGYTTPKGVDVSGLSANNLRYYKTDFIPRKRTIKNMRALVAASTDLICIKNNVYEEQFVFGGHKLKSEAARYFDDGKTRMLVIYNEQTVESFATELRSMNIDGKIKIYVFSNNRYAYNDNFEEVLDKVELCALPAAIYDAYSTVLKPIGKEDVTIGDNENKTENGQGVLNFNEKGGKL